jgi:transcriptional regulator with XRE-family HTH domain
MKEIISQKIKNARALKGLSQQELADMIGVSKQMISKYEMSHDPFGHKHK